MRRIKSFSSAVDGEGASITHALSTDGILFELREDDARRLSWVPLPELPQEGYMGDTEALAAAEMMKHVPSMVGSMFAGVPGMRSPSDADLAAMAGGLQCRFSPCEHKAADPEDMEHHVRTVHLPQMDR